MNPVVHFEMPAENMERVKKFYESAFGWKMNQMGAEMSNYLTASTDETDEKGMLKKTNRINGGFFPKMEDPEINHPSVVIAVDNLDDAMNKVRASGGDIMGEPMQIPTIGRYVAIRDTEGNRVGVLQPAERM